MGRLDMIHIDRSKRAEAWNKVAAQGQRLSAPGHLGDHVPRGHAHARAAARAPTRRGAARLAIATGAPIVPIAVTSAQLLAAQELPAAAGRDRRLDRPADPQRRAASPTS
ncbi:MAG: hypothetical protein MZW92_36620 [Comamonadaceae bacterium]|nr:hypothetical protein [Comamonadaceae bacterium]